MGGGAVPAPPGPPAPLDAGLYPPAPEVTDFPQDSRPAQEEGSQMKLPAPCTPHQGGKWRVWVRVSKVRCGGMLKSLIPDVPLNLHTYAFGNCAVFLYFLTPKCAP